jgi:hypothetical protein
MTTINFRRDGLLRMQLVPDVEASYLECQHLLELVVPWSTWNLLVDVSDRRRQLPWDDLVKRILYRGQFLQIEAHLDEGFSHDKIQWDLVVDQRLGHLVQPDQ